MNLLKTIFQFEFRLLIRQKFALSLLAFFFLTATYSIFYGYHFTKKQLIAIDSLEQGYQQKYKEVVAGFTADTSTAEGKLKVTQAGIPSVIEYRNPLYAIHRPAALVPLAIGQRDLVPYYDVITRRRNFMQEPNAEISNPEMLAAGNFDLAYFMIYLLPLLAIALSYHTWSKEKEQQTDRLLAVQGNHFKRIMVYKLVFRFLVVALLAWLLSAIGFISAAFLSPFNLTAAALWLLTISVYLFFWFAVCLFVINLGQNSAANALYLLGIWCFFLILLPSISNAFVRLSHPIPLKTDAAVALRESSEAIWAMPKQKLIDTFYFNNPKYRHLKTAADTSENSTKRFAAYYDLLGRRMTKSIAGYNRYLQKQNDIAANLSWFNPATKTQYLLNSITETGLNDYLSYQNQVNDFQKTWVDFMTFYIVYDKKLKLNDLQHLPQFILKPISSKSIHIGLGIIFLMLASGGVLAIASKRGSKI